MTQGLVTIPEAAQIKGVTRSAIYKAIERGDLKAQTILGRKAVKKRDVLAWEPRKAGRRKGSVTSEAAKSRISAAQKARWERIKREE